MESFFGTSPQSVAESHFSKRLGAERVKEHGNAVNEDSIVSLNSFIDLLPGTIRESRRLVSEGSTQYGSDTDPISELFRSFTISRDEWESYAYFDENRSYTRNLIATDIETFTLLLLCWNPSRASPIHDHPCEQGCWMKVLRGQVQECRYDYPAESSTEEDAEKCLQCIHDETYTEGQIAYINDSLGYHKVGNPTKTTPAVTMHLYCPPINVCSIWLKEDRPPSKSYSCHYSEYGVKTE